MSGFSGMKAWLIQRFSGIYVGLFAIWMAVLLVSQPTLDYAQWVAIFSRPWLQIFLTLFVLALLVHAWIGVRDIILDYIKPMWIKLIVVTLVILVLLSSGIWFLRALLLVGVS